jgi:hypothetical protein
MVWQLLALAVAIALMAAPGVVSLSDASANAIHVLAPLEAAIAAMAASTVLRGLRRLHLLLGPAIAAVPPLLGGDMLGIAVVALGGAILATLAFPGASDPRRLGGGWRAVWSPTKSTIGPRTGADRP